MPEKFISELITALVIFFLFIILVFFVVITLAVRYRKRKRENEALRVQFSEQLLSAQLEIQEQTLQHISRELHDNLGQMASLIKINLNTIRVEQPEKAITKIDNTKELVKQLVTDIKLLSTSLSGDKMSKVGLMKALQNEADRINKTGVFRSVFTQQDNIPPINDEKSIILYRMVQECLNNALKHSEASEINIDANYQKNKFILTIEDNGKGFDVAQKLADNNDTGNGLLNLQKRAAVINGTVIFASTPGGGTKTTITTNL
jgi:signal transduction histidine kinase